MSPLPLLLAAVLAQSPAELARAHRERHGAEILRDFAALLALPNTPATPDGLRANAARLVALFSARGVDMRLVEVEGAPPAVVGRLATGGARRTLGIYAHYDGQPVDAREWTHAPFAPTLCSAALEAGGRALAMPAPGAPIDPEWRLYARGSGDDRAPFAALLAALDALDGAGVAPTSELVFFFEGEEEVGSPHLRAAFERQRDELAADLWLVCDGPVHQSRRPQLAFGVRGVTSLEITLYGATRSLHSGHYGNWAPNPALMLAELVASMKDSGGRVKVAGFYDGVLPPSAAERAALATIPAVDDALRAELGLAWSEGEAPLAERLLLPALNVRGLAAAGVGADARNVIPERASASLDLRLVPGNDPAAMLARIEAHVVAQGYHVVAAEPDRATRAAHARIARLERGSGYPAARTPLDHPLAPALAAAVERAAGQPPVILPSLGGSLPLYLFEEVLGTSAVIVPIANHDDNQHAADENIRIANLWYGIELFAELLAL